MSKDIKFAVQDVRGRITVLVEEYQRLFPVEFHNFLNGQRQKLSELQADNKFATLEGSEVVERQLGEMPETLFVLLERNLTSDEYTWYQKHEGQKWFYNTFPQYKITHGKV